MTEIASSLWNDDVAGPGLREAHAPYQTAVFEQYRLCVEMADRVSGRRNLANTFFLTLNSGLVTFLGVWLSRPRQGDLSVLMLLAGLLVLLAICTTWWVTVRSYRQLNEGKFKVIAALEQRLPARAFSAAEWKALEEGRNWRIYLPLTQVEQWIPVTFAVTYVLGFASLAL